MNGSVRRHAAVGLLVTGALVLTCAPASLAHTYAGKSRKGGDMHVRLSPDESYFVKLTAKRELSCRQGRVRSFRRGSFRQVSVFVRVTSAGAFGGTVGVRGPRGSLVRGGRFRISGSGAGSGRVKGVFRERARLRGGARCDSGRVRFSIPLISTNE